MTTVQDILSYIEAIAPGYMKMEWDNVGLLCGKADQPVHKILVALDPFETVCQEALEIGADLIVTHHPLIFHAPDSITNETELGRSILLLAANNISAINAHTNLDCAPGGVNDVLAQALGLSEIHVINPAGTDEEGRPWGLLREGVIARQSLSAFLNHVKNALSCEALRFVDGGKSVYKVAVGGGSCASELQAVVKAGCDTFVTADVKYNQFWEAKALGINLIDAGHFYTENPVCPVLCHKLQARFPGVHVELSKKHTDCAKFFC